MRRARDFLILEFQVRAEDFLKGGFFGGERGEYQKPVVCLPHPPVRAPTPSLAGLKPAKLPSPAIIPSVIGIDS